MPGFKRSDLLPAVTLLFEGYEFPVPARPEAFLEATYGNWRQLPPVDDRHTHLPKHLDFGDGTTWSLISPSISMYAQPTASSTLSYVRKPCLVMQAALRYDRILCAVVVDAPFEASDTYWQRPPNVGSS